ncbi:hepatitis A virus cellular receptor 1 [Perognathus longimembris pacificus]|uniref:hepatitis A virus cellular receptor 1 n=1 Tax=Perognathus longimembris pacificus TaxID=214514 RepID=UPI00201A1771|nr:hepatitis A virus cellular receptor 1 [Perognathus longimembris pacificus]
MLITMHSQVVILSLILFLTDGAAPYVQVNGVADRAVTLPCTYSVTGGRGVTTTCWGRGTCPRSQCTDPLIWTNGHSVTYQRQPRYKLMGQIAQGNVSLTIEGVTQADSGLYCCRVEIPGWFNDQKITLSLNVQPAPSTTVATSPSVSITTVIPTTTHAQTSVSTTTMTPSTTTPPHAQTGISITAVIPTTTHAQTHKAVASASPIVATQEATSPTPTSAAGTQPTKLPGTKPQATSSPLSPSCSPDGNDTMTQSSDGSLWYNNQTQPLPAQRQWITTMSGLVTGIVISSLLLLLLTALVMKTH